jgi:dTDP-4-amino-4,6-dideoxygalactose transaminase
LTRQGLSLVKKTMMQTSCMHMSLRRASKFPAFPASDCMNHQQVILRAMQRVMMSGHFILGHEVQAFEEEFAQYLRAKHVIGVGSGTDAIELMLRALDIGPGDKVIVPSFVPSAVASGVQRSGAQHLLADVDAETLTLCPRSMQRVLESSKGRGVKAALSVHLYGHPVRWAELKSVADAYEITLLEDAAQAHGASWHGSNVGTLGCMAAFSFYPTKNLGALGDAGAVVTSDSGLAERIRQLRQYGWQRRYISEQSGINSRMDEIQAAILRAKLPLLDAQITRRRALAARYDQFLNPCTAIHRPVVLEGSTHAYHQYVIRTQKREHLREHLESHGIPVASHYPAALHQQPAWRSRGSYPESERAAKEVLSLPLHPYLSLEAVDQVVEALIHLTHVSF